MTEVGKWEVRDVQATAVAVDRSGSGVLLAGKRWLAVKRLDGEQETKKTARHSKYEVAGAEWCLAAQGRRLCCVSSNQRVDVYHWRNGELTGVHSLRGHTRAVSDTHWHREDHNLIATCSIDTFTHVWDLRDPRKPALSLAAVAGASQVQWNKVVGHLLATAHDGDVKVWDRRKGNASVQYISAHLCKIHGLDWSPHHEHRLATSSHDGTVKFFDANAPRRPEGAVDTGRPVWRAAYTPFGGGLVTTAAGRGGRARDRPVGAVDVWVDGALAHRLLGHADVVLQMQWRPNSPPDDHELVTWSRDQTLRVWSMKSLYKACSHYLPLPDDEDEPASESIEPRDPNEPRTLSEELDAIKSSEDVSLQDVDLERKTCVARVHVNGRTAVLRAAFSSAYPEDGVVPRFAWLSGTSLDADATIKILQAVNRAAHVKIRRQRACAVHCLRVLIERLQKIPARPDEARGRGASSETTEGSEAGGESSSSSSAGGDHRVPFPRTCGAKWCGVGALVTFARPPNAKRMSLKPESATPRSLSSLSAPIVIGPNYRSLSPHMTTSPSPTNLGMGGLSHHRPTHSITTFYFQDRWKTPSRRSGGGMRSIVPQFTPKVTLYRMDSLFYLNKSLAEKYIIRSDSVPYMCEHNAKVAASLGRLDLMQAWQLSALTAASLEQKKEEVVPHYYGADDEDGLGSSMHPFGSNMMQALINHYAKIADIQMAAMLCCAFSSYYGTYLVSSKSSELSTNSNGSGSSPYNTVHNISEISTEGWAVPAIKQDRPSSWSDSTDFNTSFYESSMQALGGKCREDAVATPILDVATVQTYQGYMKMYADVLHRWNLLGARAEVMKHIVSGAEEPKHSGVELVSQCLRCDVVVKGGRCAICFVVGLTCVVCNVGVRGSANACLACGHGGHTRHLEEWFNKYDVCPTGCGCRCLHETGNTLER